MTRVELMEDMRELQLSGQLRFNLTYIFPDDVYKFQGENLNVSVWPEDGDEGTYMVVDEDLSLSEPHIIATHYTLENAYRFTKNLHKLNLKVTQEDYLDMIDAVREEMSKVKRIYGTNP